MKDYKLVFTDEAQANTVIDKVISKLHPSQYVLYVIGIHKTYEYDLDDQEAPPVVTEHEGWHVDLRLRKANKALDSYVVIPETPSHNFS